MKKRILISLLTVFLSAAIYAQPSPEKKAQKLTDKITEALSLNETDSKAVYNIQLERFKEAQAINKKYGNESEEKNEKLKMLGNQTYNKMKDYLGKERMKQWAEYRKNNRK
ncbi:hypothetical protein V8G61_05005 [Gaetbulibacter sp. M240]|uniref:hypothetical protein n=1 Tax=Gaetbulibacter sp. M240 TaxID=3126511 RepID=UPI00374F43E3